MLWVWVNYNLNVAKHCALVFGSYVCSEAHTLNTFKQKHLKMYLTTYLHNLINNDFHLLLYVMNYE